jgi:multiple sugar transport system substrate-binding protein
VLSLVVGFAIATTACGGGGSATNSSSGAETKPAESAAPAGPVKLVITTSGGSAPEAFERTLGGPIKKRFPNYTIEYVQQTKEQGINEIITAGTPLDIVYETIGSMAKGLIAPGMAADISDLIKKHNIDLKQFDPVLIDGMKTLGGGKLYGLPVNTDILVTYYSKDLFDKFGLPYPKDGMTWDAMLELGNKLTREADGIKYLGFAASVNHYLKLNQYSVPFVDPKSGTSSYSDDKWKTIVDTVFKEPAKNTVYQDYMKAHKNSVPYRNEFIKDKNLAMILYLSNLHAGSYVKDLESMNWDMVSAPSFKDKPGVGTQPYPVYWNVVSTSKNKDAAMEVIKYLTSEEYQMEVSKAGSATVLTSKAVREAIGQQLTLKHKVNLGAMFYNKNAPISPKTLNDDAVQSLLEKSVPNIVLNTTDENTALRQAKEAADKVISENKAK